jgi:hypothetical protein
VIEYQYKIRPDGCMKGELLMGRRGRKQFMAKNSINKHKCFFDGITLMALHNCTVPYELLPEQDEELRKLRAYLRKKPYTVWCSQRGWDIFLKYVNEKNKEERFFGKLKEKEREHAGDLYLTYTGELKTARSLNKWDW